MANDERSANAAKAKADEVAMNSGNGHGPAPSSSVDGRTGGLTSSYATSGATKPGITTRSVTRPSPAVPLVPPVRSGSAPTAPTAPSGRVARTGVTTGGSGTIVADPRPATRQQPATAGAPSPPAAAPARIRPPVRTRMARKPRVRKVNRVVRRIDAWSVFKIALVFWTVVMVILVVAGMLLWNLAETTGTITNVEGFVKDLFGLKTFEFDGGQILRSSWIIGLVMIVGGTAFSVTLVVLFNLISDLLGGVRVTVLEEEVVLRPAAIPQPAQEAVDAGPSASPKATPSTAPRAEPTAVRPR